MKADAVICGAGIAGVSAAYSLAVENGLTNILLVDKDAPLALTSDHSTEAYRNWWPGPDGAMVQLMNRSIDRLEMLAHRSNNVFHLNRRGYLYCTADAQRAAEMERSAREISSFGAGPLRVHRPVDRSRDRSEYLPHSAEGFEDAPTGADLLLDADLIRENFPYVSEEIAAALHVRRAGWFSAQQLGMYLLEEARRGGVGLLRECVCGVQTSAGRVTGVQLANGTRIATPVFINAAGPHIQTAAQMAGCELPIYHELHLKMAMKDTRGALDRSAPLVILSDSQRLDWTPDERVWLAEDEQNCFLMEELPSGLHTRPDGGADSPIILVLWEYGVRRVPPVWPIPEDPLYPEALLRGLPRLIPRMQAYLQNVGRPRIDGGYYTRTAENRPLIGKLPVEGAFLIGALSGFGMMAACGAGELLAAHVLGTELPPYAGAFALNRYDDPVYRRRLEDWGASGQL